MSGEHKCFVFSRLRTFSYFAYTRPSDFEFRKTALTEHKNDTFVQIFQKKENTIAVVSFFVICLQVPMIIINFVAIFNMLNQKQKNL